VPTYTFQRPDGSRVKRRLTFDEYELVKSGDFKVLDTENQALELELVFNPSGIGFVLKDGPSGSWMSKGYKEKKYRAQRSQVMAHRERNHVFKTKLIPNLNGQEASTWKDVRDEVRSKSGEAAASTYDAHVAKESTTP
jgi:hypothetical protein